MSPDWPPALHVRPLTNGDAEDIATWRYGGDWAIYDSRPSDGPLRAEDGYWAVSGRDGGTLVGYCCIGFDARVPGLAAIPGVADLGVGMRPELTGRGHGAAFAAPVLDFVEAHTGCDRLRLVVQSWNTRSLRLWVSCGFAETGRHPIVQRGREVEYVVMRRG